MPATIYCLSQPYDSRLVLLAIVVCVAASFATFSLYPRALSEAEKSTAPLWIGLTTITAASAVWTTHFTAMIAFDPAISTGFDVPATVLSFAFAVFITAAGLYTAVYARSRGGLMVGGCVLGIATAMMHYVGVSGMELKGSLSWNPAVVALSIVLSIVSTVPDASFCVLVRS